MLFGYIFHASVHANRRAIGVSWPIGTSVFQPDIRLYGTRNLPTVISCWPPLTLPALPITVNAGNPDSQACDDTCK
jgi:hypothetical protein